MLPRCCATWSASSETTAGTAGAFRLHDLFYILQEQFPGRPLFPRADAEIPLPVLPTGRDRRRFPPAQAGTLHPGLRPRSAASGWSSAARGIRDMHICQAITASCAIPYFFRPHKVDGQLLYRRFHRPGLPPRHRHRTRRQADRGGQSPGADGERHGALLPALPLLRTLLQHRRPRHHLRLGAGPADRKQGQARHGAATTTGRVIPRWISCSSSRGGRSRSCSSRAR